ncbi:MAG TPA: thioredoxin domain-containing protein, partial [Flavobacterium sp.]|nr:thioredoxin domain-containing protein [Flavobacterium sp.]
ICGEASLVHLKEINQNYFPSVLLAGNKKKSDLPFLQNRFVENETIFYLCQNKLCLAPKNTISEVYKDLNY